MSRFAERPHCYVIAEAGSNHDGRYAQAEALIDAAADAGADAVKFQMFKASQLYTRDAGRSEYLGREESIYDIIEAMEMPRTGFRGWQNWPRTPISTFSCPRSTRRRWLSSTPSSPCTSARATK